jgi:hypothetical protein
MTHEKKVQYLEIACNLQKIGINKRIADQIIVTYEAILKKGGDFALSDAVDIDMAIERKYTEKDLKNGKK